jgi:hypothetical protein
MEWSIYMKVVRRINIIWNDPGFIRKDNENYWISLALDIRKVMNELRKKKDAREDCNYSNKQEEIFVPKMEGKGYFEMEGLTNLNLEQIMKKEVNSQAYSDRRRTIEMLHAWLLMGLEGHEFTRKSCGNFLKQF